MQGISRLNWLWYGFIQSSFLFYLISRDYLPFSSSVTSSESTLGPSVLIIQQKLAKQTQQPAIVILSGWLSNSTCLWYLDCHSSFLIFRISLLIGEYEASKQCEHVSFLVWNRTWKWKYRKKTSSCSSGFVRVLRRKVFNGQMLGRTISQRLSETIRHKEGIWIIATNLKKNSYSERCLPSYIMQFVSLNASFL